MLQGLVFSVCLAAPPSPSHVPPLLCREGFLSESTSISGSITRDDVAALAIKALFSKKADGKVHGRWACATLTANMNNTYSMMHHHQPASRLM